jgi:hypothetical protein
MPEVPDGAKQPSDHQSKAIKPETHADGWDLLRPPIDLEFWEASEIMALAAGIKVRGDEVDLTTANLQVIGKVVKELQQTAALDSNAFKQWLSAGPFTDQVSRVVPLAFEYAAALGEVDGSSS